MNHLSQAPEWPLVVTADCRPVVIDASGRAIPLPEWQDASKERAAALRQQAISEFVGRCHEVWTRAGTGWARSWRRDERLRMPHLQS